MNGPARPALLLFAAVLALTATAPAAAAPSARWRWSLPKVMRLIDNARIHVGSRTVRIDSETTLCSGIGRGVRSGGVRRWAAFRCTYSAFVAGGIYDCGFRVEVRGRRKYAIADARWVAGPP